MAGFVIFCSEIQNIPVETLNRSMWNERNILSTFIFSVNELLKMLLKMLKHCKKYPYTLIKYPNFGHFYKFHSKKVMYFFSELQIHKNLQLKWYQSCFWAGLKLNLWHDMLSRDIWTKLFKTGHSTLILNIYNFIQNRFGKLCVTFITFLILILSDFWLHLLREDVV